MSAASQNRSARLGVAVPGNLDAWIRRCSRKVDQALENYLPAPKTKPTTLHQAMRYSLFAGGKRMRPVLAMAAVEACGGSSDLAIPSACALECVHTYSLIHDDLPCMDDDDFRRGRPTSHKVFGEAVAVLAGDALLTLAFEILCSTPPTPRYPAAAFVEELAKAAGSRNLVGGQVADLEAEGQRVGSRKLRFIHEGKTAAMVAASLRLGAMSADAPPDIVKSLGRFGQILGLAFQVVDDILDVTQPTSKLGKSAGKDARDRKSTYPSLLGLSGAKSEAKKLTAEAKACLPAFGSHGRRLEQLADYLLKREY